MSDVHEKKDLREIDIKNVGICDYYAPFILKNDDEYITNAEIKSGVSIDKEIKGAHLSRINMVLNKELVNKTLTINDIKKVVKTISNEVGVDNANIELKFKVFFQLTTPKSNMNTNLSSNIRIYMKVVKNEVVEEKLSMSAVVAMLCPNSKEKSSYGAHSQKCLLNATISNNISNVKLKEMFMILSSSGSAPVFDIVRSSDEVYMTELAYDHPKFSEDAIRDILISLKKKYKNCEINAELKNLESIHQHNVFCEGNI